MNAMKKSGQVYIDIDIILIAFIPLVLLGKLVRFTLMKESLVVEGIGHHFLRVIVNHQYVDEEGPGRILSELVLFFSRFGARTYLQQELIFTLLWNILLFMLLLNVRRYLTIGQAAFLVCSIMVLNIFAFTLAKEPIQMLYFLLVYEILCRPRLSVKKKYVLSVLAIIFASITFRAYYIMIAIYMAGSMVLMNAVIKKKMNILAMSLIFLLMAGTVYFIILNAARLAGLPEYDELVRVRSQARGFGVTVIAPSFRTDNLFYLSVNYVLVMIRMLFPVELIRLGVKYFPYVFYKLLITVVFLSHLSHFKTNSQIMNLSLTVYIGFLCCSVAFEPDFGSWVRHESVVFPVFIIMSGIKTFGKEALNGYSKKNSLLLVRKKTVA